MSPFHPELRALARWLPRGVANPVSLRLFRLLPSPSRKVPPGVSCVERVVEGPAPVRVRVIGAASGGSGRPAMLWIHGGGYVIGSASQDDALCARFAQRLGLTVISVDYRLAPEHPYPAALDDCLAAYEFLHREAGTLGIDPARLVVAGQSAGGGLAAALVQRLHDGQRPAPRLQLLLYPMLDDRTVLREVSDRNHRMWNPSSNRFGWTSYLGQAPGGAGVPAHAAPSRRTDLAGLPPAWVGVGTLDLFHDEDVRYATRLREAGVPTELEVVEGAFHGFDAVAPNKPVSQRFFDSQVAAIERALR